MERAPAAVPHLLKATPGSNSARFEQLRYCSLPEPAIYDSGSRCSWTIEPLGETLPYCCTLRLSKMAVPGCVVGLHTPAPTKAVSAVTGKGVGRLCWTVQDFPSGEVSQ